MRQPLFGKLAAAAIVLGTSGVFSQPSQAQTRNQFFCGISEGKPATIVRTAAKGPVPLIVWNNEAFSGSGWTPKRRCEDVSARFQRFNDNGQLRFMRAGTFNGQQVLCVDRVRGSGNCSSAEAIVLTVPRPNNANQILEEMLNTRNRASKQPLYLSGEKQLVTYENGFANVNLNQWFENELPDNERLW
ncbi:MULTISPECIES: COP23 domain-containing protein [unclassified Microcoleus]|uniref:COP23 domain-containing protein n=1 Tax=unclassified Microcoleus TaxID=2642155 RepID=UPI0025CC2B1D|nr:MULTISPECIES: COP23 domain-containing protein [unclassified Microcoleus]